MADDQDETLSLDPRRGRAGAAPVLRGRYRLDAEIGRGGMGIVYRATDLELQRSVAVKLRRERESSTESRERILREARAAAALNHPNIVAVHDIGEERDMPFFVMELVEGTSLEHDPPRELRRIVDIACDLCAALGHAHEHGVVHRDLKPANVLLAGPAASGAVKLADLGLAAPATGSRITREGAIVGTAAYMPPEQALGRPVDGRSDLYSLGVLLYELVTGQRPFTGDDPLAVISQHVHAPVVPPRMLRPDLPHALEHTILRLLAKEPGDRPATAAETAVALRSALEEPPARADGGSVATIALLDALARGRLVGRAAELTEARELWRRARDGRGHCLLISGEPGAGKTRLARELLIQAAVDGGSVLTGASYEFEATTPYLPFVEAFRRWARDLRDDDALRRALGDTAPLLARLAPELETRLGPFPARPELPPHEERLLFFDAVAQFFRGLVGGRGVLFYVDDLHWADSGTLWLLGHLLRQLRDERVLFVASYREVELDRAHPLSKALVDWNRERLLTRIALRRFGPVETRCQLAALLNADVDGGFADAVHRETEGNPFFVEEVLKALIEQGAVRREDGRWATDTLANLVIPQSVKAAIGNRLDRVSPACNEVLRTAAVLGKTFRFPELLLAESDRGEDPLLDALDEAVASQLVIAGRDGTFSFTHDKIREVLYEELNPIRRRRLHRRVADGLEKCSERGSVPAETLAHHYIEAGDHERGLGFAKQAAAEAERVFAYDEAVAFYERALECAESLGLEDEQLDLEEATGRVHLQGGDQIAGLAHFERALARARDPVRRASLQCLAAVSLVTLGDERGLAYVREALAVLDPASHPLETARALAIEARFHHLAGRHRRAIELLERAVPLVEPSPGAELPAAQAATLSTVLAYLSGANQHLGRLVDANAWARRSLEHGTRHNVPLLEAMGYEFLGENSVTLGDWKQGLEYAARGREVAPPARPVLLPRRFAPCPDAAAC